MIEQLSDAALDTFDKALAIDPNYPPAYFFRGQVLAEAKGDRAGAARAGEEVRVPDAPFADRVAQRGDDVLLTDDLTEPLRAVLAIQRLRRHDSTLPSASDALVRPGRYEKWLARARPGDPAAPGRTR